MMIKVGALSQDLQLLFMRVMHWLTTLSVDPHSRQFYSIIYLSNREFPLKFSLFFCFSIFLLKIRGLH